MGVHNEESPRVLCGEVEDGSNTEEAVMHLLSFMRKNKSIHC